MRKKLTLLFVALVAVAAFALQVSRRAPGSVFTLTLNGTEVSSPEGFFTHDTSGKFNFNAKFTGAEYDGISFTKGLKMEGTTKVLFTTTEISTVTIVQSTWSDNTIKLDGNELAVADAVAGTGCRIYTVENVAAGDHTIGRGSAESGIFYVKVQYPDTPDLWTEYNFTSFDFNKAEIQCSNSSNVGDITAETGNLVITDTETGVKMTVTPSTSNTPNRFWSTANGPQLRVYGGTMTFEAPEGMVLQELTFNNGKWNAGNTADVGTLADGKWTGLATKVVVTIAANTQINSIVAKIAVKKDRNFFITGDFNNFAITGLPQMEWNEENKAYEYILAVNDLEKASFFITDVASVDNFMGLEGHRFSVDANMNTEVQAGQTITLANNNGTMKLTEKGKYLLSLSEDLKLTISKVYEDAPVNAAPGDITEAIKTQTDGKFVGNLTLNLQNGDYTITEPISAAGSIVINGNGAKIDASALEAAMITTPAGDLTEWQEGNIIIKDANIKGVKKGVFASARKNFLYKNFTVDNCLIEIASTSGLEFDFRKGSVAENFNILNSTIYAPTATANSLYTSQSAQKGTEAPGVTVQTFTIENSTLYNLAKSKNFFTHRQSNQKWLAYTLKNNIFVNCGKSGQVVKGINGGQSGTNPTWIITGNSFNFDGADTSSKEETGDPGEPVKDNVPGVVEFADAANGDFTLSYSPQQLLNIGDPRWNNSPEQGGDLILGSQNAELKFTVDGVVVLDGVGQASVKENAAVIVDVTPKDGYVIKGKIVAKPSSAIKLLTINANKYAFAMHAGTNGTLGVSAKFMAVLKAEWISPIADKKYTGKAIRPNVILTDEYTGERVPYDEYTVEYANNVEAGEATVTVKGKDKNYTGEVTVKFNIIRQELKDEWIDAIPNQAWTGEAVEPEIIVTDMVENKVIDPENYTVEFANNVDAGEATVTVKAKENNYYIGQATAKFNIIKIDEAKAEDGSSFWYRVTDEASKEATILHMEPASADVESFTIPATVDGYDVVAVMDGALNPDNVAKVKDFYLPAVKGHAIAGITSEMLIDTEVYHHPSKVARIHTSLEALGEYAQTLDYFTDRYKVSAVKEAAPRFWTLSCSVNVQISDGKVYIVKEKDSESVEKIATGSKLIAAGNGVLIEGVAGQNYTVTAVPEEELKDVEVDYSGNLLVAVTTPTHFEEGYYILKNGEFHAAGGDADAMVPAGKAVLYLPAASAPILTISGEATGIKIANADDLKDAQIYDMNGRKVEGVPAQKGIYIVKGKKVSFK